LKLCQQQIEFEEQIMSTRCATRSDFPIKLSDLAHEDQIERRIERRSDLRCDSNPTARQREDRRLLLFVSGKR
jgi:hypothetical protein